MLFVWDIKFWRWASLIAVSHLLTDVLKLYAQHDKTKRTWFFFDQALHLLFIYLVWIGCQDERIVLQAPAKEYIIALVTILYALTQPASVIIRSFISRWTPDDSANNRDSLDKAGKYIGILERLFVFAFVITNNWAAIGFLLAAKSVFRFGDLKGSGDRKRTEYVLIGTLLSFGIAMLAGILFLKIILFLHQPTA